MLVNRSPNIRVRITHTCLSPTLSHYFPPFLFYSLSHSLTPPSLSVCLPLTQLSLFSCPFLLLPLPIQLFVCLSILLSLSLYVSISPSFNSLSPSLCACLSITQPFSPHQFLSPPSISLFYSLCLFLPLSLYVSLTLLQLPFYLSIYLSIYLYQHHCLSPSLSQSFYVSHSICHSFLLRVSLIVNGFPCVRCNLSNLKFLCPAGSLLLLVFPRVQDLNLCN